MWMDSEHFENVIKREHAKETIHIISFEPISKRGGGTKIYSSSQCSLTVNECDWHILAATKRELNHIVWLGVLPYSTRCVCLDRLGITSELLVVCWAGS